jgi:hypothetical protein
MSTGNDASVPKMTLQDFEHGSAVSVSDKAKIHGVLLYFQPSHQAMRNNNNK